MSESTPDAPLGVTCPNCRRTETRAGVRFCPHCGAVLPVLTQTPPTGAGFSALAQAIRPEQAPESPQPVLKPVPPAVPQDAPHQPWASDQEDAPVPQITPSRRPAVMPSLGTFFVGCLAVLGTIGVVIGLLILLFCLGVLLICSGVHC